MEQKIAEVIEASIVEFTAQCYELYEVPPLGALVKTGDIYGIVANAETTGMEPGRKPIARGKDEATEEAVYNSLFMARTVTGYAGHTVDAIPVDKVLEICRERKLIRETR